MVSLRRRWLLLGLVLVLLAATALVPRSTPADADPVAASPAAVAAVPHYDHVLVVVDENHSHDQVIGSPDAPWTTALAANNAHLTQSYAITHPSQPNYFALYSGSTQGVTDDACPYSFSTPDLGSELFAAGLTFTGYSESMPSAGYTGCASGAYARKHNPWVAFPAVPASANQPLTALPSDWSALPTVSFVVPNLLDDMHDGSVAAGDAWLASTVGGYVDWAKTHNSLFVLTFDEDDNVSGNRIPTVLAGAGVAPGSYGRAVTHYDVLRTIQDAVGVAPIANSATATPLTEVFAPPVGAGVPTASFTSSCQPVPGGTCSFDGRGSTDGDGTVQSWSWDLGDGTTATGATVDHAYARPGVYTVTLTVVDDAGLSASTRRTVTAGGAVAADSFRRTVTNGWGVADLGGSWTTSGTAANFAVSGGTGTVALPGTASQGARLTGVSRTDTDLQLGLALDALPRGGNVYLSVAGRRVGSAEYDLNLAVTPTGVVQLRTRRIVSGVDTSLSAATTLPGGVAAGQVLRTRLQVTGTSPTTVRARVWKAGTVEPTTWPMSTTDAAAGLQAAGVPGVFAQLASATVPPVTLAVSDVLVAPTQAAANQPPTAVAGATCTDLACSFTAAGSADPDGTVTGYAWDFGDGATGTGATASHTYAVAGTYAAVLTVTDDKGATGTATRSVTVTAPPLNRPPIARVTASCAGRTCTFDGSGSTDDEGITAYRWSFDDGGTATGAVVGHTFTTDGPHTASVTVTDAHDATDTATVTVAVSTVTTLARDSFARTVTNGWGSADTGGAWTLSGAAGSFAVRPGTGAITLPTPGSLRGAYLTGVSGTGVDLSADIALPTLPTGGPVYVSLVGRRVTASTEYGVKLVVEATGATTLRWYRTVSGAETALGTAWTLAGGLAAGTRLTIRAQVVGTGPTTLRARAWRTGTTEPTAWPLTVTDATAALQAPGWLGVSGYLSSRATGSSGLTVASLVATAP